MLNGFGTVVNSLKMRAKPYLPQICGTIKWRLNNKGAKIRQQAADLIARIAIVMKARTHLLLLLLQCLLMCVSPSGVVVNTYLIITSLSLILRSRQLNT